MALLASLGMAAGSKMLGGLMGGGSGGSKSNPDSIFQGGQFEDLFKRAQQASYGDQGTKYGQSFEQPAQQAWMNQAGGGYGYDTSALQGLAGGNNPFGQFAGQQDQNLQAATQAGLDQMTRNFQQNIMPSINSGAVASGTSGGSRQGIAQGLAASEVSQQGMDFTNQMYSQNYQQNQNRNLQAMQSGVNATLGASNAMNQYSGMQNQAQQNAFGSANQLANLGFSNQYGNLAGLKSILGNPTKMGGGSESSQSSNKGGLFGAVDKGMNLFNDGKSLGWWG